MDVQLITKFFMWCTILNFAILMLVFVLYVFGRDSIYKIHGKLFSISRETFNIIFYSSIGLYKILFFVFNVVPWVVLEILKNIK